MRINNNGKRYYEIGILCFFFLFFFIFFTLVHPLYVFDTDDWINMGLQRSVFPSLNAYNPIKVFPEVLFSLVTMLCARILYPISGDYIGSLAFGTAFIFSSVLILNCLCVYKFIKHLKTSFSLNKEPDENFISHCLLVIFIICLFYFGRNGNYLLRENDVTCIFHYTIPAIVIFSVVLILIVNEDSNRQILCFNSNYKNVFWGLILYFCIFSNLFFSSVLIAYIAYLQLKRFCLLVSLSKEKKIKDITKHYVIQNYQYITVIFLWCISAYFEANGERALVNINNKLSFLAFSESLHFFFYETLHSVAFGKFGFVGFLILLSANLLLVSRLLTKKVSVFDKKFLEIEIFFLWMFFFIALYHILLTIKTGIWYQQRASMVYSWFVWILLLFFSSFIYISAFYSKINLFTPIVIFILIYRVCIHEPVLYETTYVPNSNIYAGKVFSNYLIKTLVDSDRAGIRKVKLYVPKFNNGDNFPLAVYANNALADTMYLQGLTKNLLEIEIIPDENLNDLYMLK